MTKQRIEKLLMGLERELMIGEGSSEDKVKTALETIRSITNSLCIERRREEESQMIADSISPKKAPN